jgi:DNA recombination protein RmuC
MSDSALLTLVTLFAFGAGAALVYFVLQRRIGALRESNATLQTTLDLERRAAQERQQLATAGRDQLVNTFTALATDALARNNEAFLNLAQQNLRQFQVKAQSDLEQKEKAIETLLKPVKDALEKTEVQLRQIEHERKEAYGSLSKHLELMAQTQQQLHGETRNLVQALRRPEVRGQWGEMTLKRLAELAGMVQHCDFYEQESLRTEQGLLRPDMIVRMPDGREIVVDAKTPLDAYLGAIEATDDATRDAEYQRHARKVRERVKELAGKAYWSQFKNAPDFVVLFIPGEQFLSAALDQDRDLLEDALRQKVILATPTSFVALLRAVAYGWRQEALAENAEQIRHLGEEMYNRLITFADAFAKVGKSLDSSVSAFNKAVGSFDARVLPAARKFTELGITPKEELEQLEQIEKAARDVESRLFQNGTAHPS